jgi:hypothetical protein
MKICHIIIAISLFSCNGTVKLEEPDLCGTNNFYQKVERVSFDHLNRMRTLDGKFVEIEGTFYANFEDVALYPFNSTSSASRAIWINFANNDSLFNLLNKKHVQVVGKVNMSHKGHMDRYFAEFDSVFCMKEIIDK